MRKKMLTTGEAAKYCGVHFRTVSRWIDKGLLKAHQLPGRGDNRIQLEDFVQFLRENQLPVPAELQSSQCVLVIDDDVNMAKAIGRNLRQAGYEPVLVHSGFEAGSAIHQYQPRLITLDLKMPGLDGLGVIEYIRHNIQPAPRILVVSGADKQSLSKALDAGVDGVIEKPFDADELIGQVEQLLSS